MLEVRHRMSENVTTWGELYALTGREPGDTDARSPVIRLATGGQVLRGAAAAATAAVPGPAVAAARVACRTEALPAPRRRSF